jgi:hypothetical protein
LSQPASDAVASLRTALQFERRGHACTRQLLTPAEMHAVGPAVLAAWSEAEAEQHGATLRREDREFAPFLQTFNPHRRSADVLALVTSKRFTSVARRLLLDEDGDGGDDGGEKSGARLRLYQTAIFAKLNGHDETAWHTDLGTAPLDTNAMVTVWLPLEAVAAKADGGTALTFARGSHRDVGGFWFDLFHDDVAVEERYGPADDHGALECGDATWHHGWTLHAAPACTSPKRARYAFTATYVAADAKALPRDKVLEHEDAPSYEAWVDEVQAGQILDHPLLPIVD